MVDTLGYSADDSGAIPGRGAEKGSFNFLAAFECFGWHFKPYVQSAIFEPWQLVFTIVKIYRLKNKD